MSLSLLYDFRLAEDALGQRIKAAQKQSAITSASRVAKGCPLSQGPDGRPKPSPLRNCTNALELKPRLLMQLVRPNISSGRGHKRAKSG
jgi:hypothetical protein